MSQQSSPDPGLSGKEKILAELCTMHRFYIEGQFKIYTLFAFGNGALLAAYWTMRTHNDANEDRSVSGFIIRFGGIVVCWACLFLAWRLGRLADEYAKSANAISNECGGLRVIIVEARDRYNWIAILILTVIVTLAWGIGYFKYDLKESRMHLPPSGAVSQ